MHRFAFIILYTFSSIVAGQNTVKAQDSKPLIAFTSDTQEPLKIEKLLHKADHNLEATQMIFKEIIARRPSAVFILGDVVSLGKKASAWKNIDRNLEQAKLSSVPVYATLGNHDVMFNAKKGIRNFKIRFPTFDPAGYDTVIDSVAVVLLNSNFGTMGAAEISKQNNWYQQKLKDLDNDPAVRLVIVGCHHSPFTNSKVVRPSLQVQKSFLPPFIASAKCVLFLSGHSHNYEQFKIQGKDFIVIGGGGGLHQGVKANNKLMNDVALDYKPIFHYLEIRRQGNKLNILSRKLAPDFNSFVDGLAFTAK